MEISKILKNHPKISKFHQSKTSPNILKTSFETHSDNQGLLSSTPKPAYSALSDLKNPTILINLLCLIIFFTAVSFNYYMISIYMKYVGGNIFVNVLLSAISEVIAAFSCGYTQQYLGTKYTLLLVFSMSVVCSAPLLWTENMYVIAICVFTGKFFLAGGFIITYYISSDSFPTMFIPFAMSSSNFIGRILTMFAPLVAEVRPRGIPILVLIAISTVAIFSSFTLRSVKT